MLFVGPRQTEYASTQGTITATSTTQYAFSKKSRNANASAVIAASFAKSAIAPRPARWKSSASTPNAAATSASCAADDRRNGSARYTRKNTAGITSSESTATSPHVDVFGSESWKR